MTTAARPTEERAHDLTGIRSGRLVAVKRNGKGPQRQAMWLCLCDCGKEVTVMAQSLTRQRTKSCGCYGREVWREQAAVMRSHKKKGHGCYGTPTHKSWTSMHARCTYPGTNGYHNYGGRGIGVCERWEKFENFLSDMGERPRGTTIERKDQNGNYEPSNCVWATNGEQARNRRNNHLIEFQGITKCLSDWASDIGVTPTTLMKRIASWTLGDALTRPKNLQKVTR